MKAFLVDDEALCLEELAWQLAAYPDIQIEGKFTDPCKALEAACDAQPDAVFLDIDMPHMDGLELALRMQSHCAGVMLVFVTGYARYALDAYRAYPLDFIVKPAARSRLDETVAHLRRQYALLHPKSGAARNLLVRCFGAFEVKTESAARFVTRRVKELFLYLIDRRGTAASTDEMMDALFGGRDEKSTRGNLYVTLSRLRTLLECWDPSGIRLFLTDAGALQVAPGVCDYTDFMRFAKANAAITGRNAAEAAAMLKLCRGPYLENETFEWSVESGEEVEAEYERIALGVSGCQIADGKTAEAEATLCALLARNLVSTDGYAALLGLYMRGRDHAAYAALYEEYARMLRKEFRIKPEAVFQEHMARIRR